LALGLVSSDPENYGGLRLLPPCRPLLKGEAELQLRLDRKVSIKAPKAAKARLQIPDADMDLWQLLRELRMALAQDQKVPPYVIFSDSSLLEMLHAKPQSLLEMSHVHGVGEKKLDRYGDDFLALIQQHA